MSATVTDSDLQLLARYTRQHAEDAFAELVRRHVDLVHSAALRQVRSPQLAEEVAQSVFTDLARNAQRLARGGDAPSPEGGRDAPSPVCLSSWLYTVTRRTAIDVVRREARRQLREQIATEMNAMNASGTGVSPIWSEIEPLLDEAVSALDDTDRAAVLLRYFENKSLREVGATLGTSDDAAQKRVSRAVERLREFFAKRGVTVGASGLVVVISANAVQAAPIGLAVTISATAALAGTTIATTATATATKAIAMTTLQKTMVTATVAVLAGAGIYEARQASALRSQVQSFQQQQAPLTEQIGELSREREEAARQLAALRDENERLNRNTPELVRLRAEVTRIRNAIPPPAASPVNEPSDVSNPLWRPNWIVLTPFDLAQFPDSETQISDKSAKDVGIATPAALLQTWTWALRTGDAAGILRTWDFPDGTTEEQKMERLSGALRDRQYALHALQNPDRVSHAETSKLRDLFELGDGYYLAFIEQKGLTTRTWVGHQFFRRVGDEWKVSFGRSTN